MLRLKNRGKYMGSRKHTLIATTAAGNVYFVGLVICLLYRSHLNCISQRIYIPSVPAEKYQRSLSHSTTHEPLFELPYHALLACVSYFRLNCLEMLLEDDVISAPTSIFVLLIKASRIITSGDVSIVVTSGQNATRPPAVYITVSINS